MMLKSLRENFVLKVISLLVSLFLWLYVWADRYPNSSYTKSVSADVARTGKPSPDVIVRIRPEPLQIDVTGPKAEVDSIIENEIKAEVDVSGARVGMTQLKITRFRKPSDAPNIDVKGRQYVSVDVFPKARSVMDITPLFNMAAAPSSHYGTMHFKPGFASISGASDDLKRVSRLVVSVEASGQPINADLPILAEDRDHVEVAGVEISPSMVHVDRPLEQAPATRNLVVNPTYRGKPATGFALTDVIAEPFSVTVAGKDEQIQVMSNIPTQELDINGISGDTIRQVALRPPDGVTVVGGRPTVRVTFRVSEIAKLPVTGGP